MWVKWSGLYLLLVYSSFITCQIKQANKTSVIVVYATKEIRLMEAARSPHELIRIGGSSAMGLGNCSVSSEDLLLLLLLYKLRTTATVGGEEVLVLGVPR